MIFDKLSYLEAYILETIAMFCQTYVCVMQRKSIQKQTKNRNETGSNLSLGTRLTVLSKRLGRKRCCDATPDRCLEGVPSHFLRFAL